MTETAATVNAATVNATTVAEASDTNTDIAAAAAAAAAAASVSKTTHADLREGSSSPADVAVATSTPSNSNNINNDKENSANAAVTTSSSSEEKSSVPPIFPKRPATAIATSSEPDREYSNAATCSAKRSRTSPNDNEDESGDMGAPLDLAVTLGYKPGDRIEVQWEIENDGEVVVKWWGATLNPFDGRTTDSVAIRTLHYDACPELGFSEPSDEDVIFLGHDLLVTPDSTTQLCYRKEGEEEEVFWLNEDDMDEQLNTILMEALSKNQRVWQSLPAAQQAVIAEKINTKKEELLRVLRSKKEVITSSSIKDILRETFGGAAPSST